MPDALYCGRELKCTPLSESTAVGKTCVHGDVLTRELPCYRISDRDAACELRRIIFSIYQVKKELHKLSWAVSYNTSPTDGHGFTSMQQRGRELHMEGGFSLAQILETLTGSAKRIISVYRGLDNRATMRSNLDMTTPGSSGIVHV
jgi:hypothetical protein